MEEYHRQFSNGGRKAYTSPSDFSVVHKFLLLSNPLNVNTPEDSLLHPLLFSCSFWNLLLLMDFLSNVFHEHNSVLMICEKITTFYFHLGPLSRPPELPVNMWMFTDTVPIPNLRHTQCEQRTHKFCLLPKL